MSQLLYFDFNELNSMIGTLRMIISKLDVLLDLPSRISNKVSNSGEKVFSLFFSSPFSILWAENGESGLI